MMWLVAGARDVGCLSSGNTSGNCGLYFIVMFEGCCSCISLHFHVYLCMSICLCVYLYHYRVVANGS